MIPTIMTPDNFNGSYAVTKMSPFSPKKGFVKKKEHLNSIRNAAQRGQVLVHRL